MEAAFFPQNHSLLSFVIYKELDVHSNNQVAVYHGKSEKSIELRKFLNYFAHFSASLLNLCKIHLF